MNNAVSAEQSTSRATPINGALLEFLHVDSALRDEVAAQRHVLRDIGTALAQLLHFWDHRSHLTRRYHSLEELLCEQDAARHQRGAAKTARCPNSHSDGAVVAPTHADEAAEWELLVEARLLDPLGLPVGHVLLFGSLTPLGLSRLLDPIQQWLHWFSERLPMLLRDGGVSATGATVDVSKLHGVMGCAPSSCPSQGSLPASELVKLCCAALARVLEYCRLSTVPQTPQPPLLAQLLVRGPGAVVVDMPLDLRALRANVRFMLVDLQELRDSLREAAVRMMETEPDMARALSTLSAATDEVVSRLYQTIPNL